MLKEEKLNVLFLVETDKKSVKTPEEYTMEGFIAVVLKREMNEEMVRTIALMGKRLTRKQE